jgi:hypothetical protein
MEAIKNAVFTACLCAILTSAVRLLSAERMKNELRLVCGLVMILCVAAQISGEDMSLSFTELSLADDSAYSELNDEFSQTVVAETKRNAERRLMTEITGQGVAVKKISIDCTLDEYNSVEARSACIYLSEDASADEVAAAKSTAAELLPDTEIEVICGEYGSYTD